ncbi:MAG: substrate-binding domain-containing protein [Prevotellaceae bacterium]|jgi:phosphate transport system substrate-binding protein|nr:substrate-binding domain-containing protein [Prevotellaceae bacterium]
MGRFTILLVSVLLLTGCDNRKRITRMDTPTSGVATFVSDDCFAHIVQEEVDVFEALNQEAALLPVYAGEKEAVDLLLQDSVRLAILARDLTEQEKQHIRHGNKQLAPRSQKIAVDGIALIIHRTNVDSLISVATLQEVMTGRITSWKQLNPASPLNEIRVVFDNPSSSTVRFIHDSICKGERLSETQLSAVSNNQAVLDYVAKTPNALGVIGVNWISNPNDTAQLSFTNKIRVMSVSQLHPAMPSSSYKPYPAYLHLRSYPLTRDVYVVLTDLRGTLPAGFTSFVASDRGQRIILKSGLVPATKPIRTVQVKEKFSDE